MVTIADLLKEPFGSPAYWENDILSEECKSVKARLLKLENVILTCDGKITGFVSFNGNAMFNLICRLVLHIASQVSLSAERSMYASVASSSEAS